MPASHHAAAAAPARSIFTMGHMHGVLCCFRGHVTRLPRPEEDLGAQVDETPVQGLPKNPAGPCLPSRPVHQAKFLDRKWPMESSRQSPDYSIMPRATQCTCQ